MARRSPLNARYQKNTAPAGKTRKSASAAKPKREAGGHAPEPAKKKRPTLREAMASQPSTPEMKRWRLIWFGLILAALAVALASLFIPAVKQQPYVTIASVLYLICLGSAVYIDMRIIRRLRREAIEAAKSEKKK